MADVEQIVMVKAMSGESDEATVSAYLEIAGSKICRRAYPFDPTVTEVPEQYKYIQVEIAVYLLNKRGADGETAHSENGISRSYSSGDVPPEMLRDVIPTVSVI